MIWGDAHLTDRPVMTWSTRCFLPVAKKVSMKIRFEPMEHNANLNITVEEGKNMKHPEIKGPISTQVTVRTQRGQEYSTGVVINSKTPQVPCTAKSIAFRVLFHCSLLNSALDPILFWNHFTHQTEAIDLSCCCCCLGRSTQLLPIHSSFCTLACPNTVGSGLQFWYWTKYSRDRHIGRHDWSCWKVWNYARLHLHNRIPISMHGHDRTKTS